MPISARLAIAFLITLVVSSFWPLYSQEPAAGDRPTLMVPLRPLNDQERQEREALKLYALGLLCEQEDRLLEAKKAFEDSTKLDPRAAPVFKALVPIYLALDRSGDALEATRKVLDLDAADYETWYLYARQLRAAGKHKDAIAALRRGVACPKAREDRPDLCQQMYQDLGTLHETAREYDPAAAAFTEAVKILDHPDALLEVGEIDRDEARARAAEAYEHIGRIWIQAGKFDNAAAAFRKAQTRSPAGAARLSFNLAQVYNEQGKYAEALGQLDTYLRLGPQAREPYELKISLLNKLGRKDEVVPWLEKASALDKRNVGLKLLLARTCASTGISGKAETVYKDLAEHNPSADVYRGLFRLYLDSPQMGAGRALDLLDRTLEKARKEGKGIAGDPAPAQARAILAALRDDAALAKGLLQAATDRLGGGPNMEQQTLHLMAALADRAKQLDVAERFYRKSLQAVTPQTEPLVYGGLLRVLWKAHKYDEVVALCRDGLKAAQATNRVLFHSDLARALARLGKMDEAVTQADEAVRLAADADRLMLRHLRVRVLVQAGRLDKAETECQALLKDVREPGDVLDARYLLSHVYSSAGNYPKAEEQLQWMLKADAANATACNDLGYLWADQGKNLDEAEKLIRKALELDREQRRARPGAAAEDDQDNAAYVDSLGWVLFRRGRFEEARKELERAVNLPDGDDPVLYDHLGDAFFRLHQTERARNAWRQAQRLYEKERRPDRDQRFQDLRHKLQLLERETP
jgi:tetratricopeptide (TPR) repeat protein